jgi:GMP synthase-like glutamine amidotransferase
MAHRAADGDDSGESTSWIVLRHAQAEGLGLLANALRERGIQHRALDVARGEPVPRDVRGLGGLIVLGGPMGAYEQDKHPFLKAESALIEKAITAGRPVLGICLGAQLIAQVLGARVFPGDAGREVGWAPVTLTAPGQDDPLFFGIEPSFTVFHMHGDTYELPPDAENLATSATYEQQAFRWGDVVYGFQFHLEFTESIIGRLTTEADSQRFMTEAGADPKQIVTAAPAHVRALTDTAQRVFESYFSQCGL